MGVVFPMYIYLYIIECKFLYKDSNKRENKIKRKPFSYSIKIGFPLRLYLLVELLLSIFTNSSARAGYDTRSVFLSKV